MTISDQEAVALLTEMVRTPSLCGEEDAVAGVLRAAMGRFGYATEVDEVGNVIGTIGRADAARSIVILGHMDTVPGVIPVKECAGQLYGRGTVDAKGPLAAGVVAAARAAVAAGLRLTVIGAVQEEGPSVGARHLLRRQAPDFLLIAEPSGWDAIVLGYKGSQRFTIELRQPSAHSAGAESTASERLVDFWNRLVVWCSDQSPSTESGTSFDRLTATLLSMASSSDGLHDSATFSIGLRLPPGMALETVREGARSLLPEGSFTFSPGEPAVRGEKSNKLVSAFLRSIRQEGATPRFKVKTGTSDLNVVGPVWQCPMVAYGPGDSSLDHTPNEHVEIVEYLCAIRVLTRVLEELS